MFTKVECDKGKLKPRFYPSLSSVCNGKKMLLIGGWECVTMEGDLLCGSTRVVHVYDTEKHNWEEMLTTGTNPAAIVHHTAVAISDTEVLVLGGCDDMGRGEASFTYILNIDTKTWTIRPTKIKPSIKPTDPPPLPHSSHTAVQHPDGSIYVFGGNAGLRALNNLWRYTPDNNEWELMPVKDQRRPSPRQYHTSCYAKGKLYVFGGAPDNKTTKANDTVFNDLWYYELSTQKWVQMDNMTGAVPSPRGSCTSVFISPYLYLYGGFDGRSDLGSLHKFDVDACYWEELEVPSWLNPRWGAGAAQLKNTKGFLIFGGYSVKENKMFNDTITVAHEIPSLKYLVAKHVNANNIDYR